MTELQDNGRSGNPCMRQLAASIILLVTILAAGCGSQNDASGTATISALAVNTPAAISIESDNDYNNNVYGLITGATLKRWKDDWVNQRPAGITGKLVILQVTTGEAGYEYFKPNNLSVFTYLAAGAEWVMTRSNGVINTQSMVLDGPSIDTQLKKYGIDPRTDMIVCAQGTASTGNVMNEGRCWFALRYWGVDAKHLAVLNGGNKWQFDSAAMVVGDFQATASSPPNNGLVSVKDLPVDNTALQATVQDMLAIVPSSDLNVKTDGVFLWDARTISQYSAGDMFELGDSMGTTPASNCASAYCLPPVGSNYMVTFQNNGSRQGHLFGALDLNFNNLLDSTQGYSFKSKAQLTSYLNGEVDANGHGMVDSTYSLVGAGNAYQPGDMVYVFCETTFRAMITGIASAVILGKPTRFYDGAMVEWNSLSFLQDTTGNYILPQDSPWRTDVKSFFKPASSYTLVAQRQIIDPYAPNAEAVIQADKAYKMSNGTSGSSSGSGGSGLPPNPCGG